MTSQELKAQLLKDIKETGFPLEMEISSILEKRGWHVSNGLYYIDKDEEKGREIDIVATINKSNLFAPEEKLTLEVVFTLIFEIKESKAKPWVFFTSENRWDSLPKRFTSGGFKMSKASLSKLLRKYTIKSEKRRGRNFYIGFSGNGARDDIYKALSGLTKAINYFIDTDDNENVISGDRLLNYFEQIIVIRGKLFEAFVSDNGEVELTERKYIQTNFNYLSPNYLSEGENVIHVISEDYLEKFLANTEESLKNFYVELFKENTE